MFSWIKNIIAHIKYRRRIKKFRKRHKELCEVYDRLMAEWLDRVADEVRTKLDIIHGEYKQ